MSELRSDAAPPATGEPVPAVGRNELAAAAAVIAVSALLFGLGIAWDLPSARGWNYDEITPNVVHKTMRRGLSAGWPDKYPPLQFRILAPLYRAVLAVDRHTAWSPTEYEVTNVWFLTSRAVSLLLGIATVWLTWRASRRLVAPGPAVLGTTLVAFCLPMVYFSKLGNLDVPSLFWFAASYVVLLRLLDGHHLLDYALLGATAAAAVATKDLVYGLYAAVPFVLLPGLVARRRERGAARPWLGLAAEPRLWTAVGASAAVLVAAYGPGRPGVNFFAQHWERITGGYTDRWRMFPPTLAGHLENVALTGRNLLFSWGAPLSGAVALGLALAWRRRQGPAARARLAVPLVLAVVFHLTTLSVILYQFDRYLLPFAVLFAPFAGVGLASALGPRNDRWRRGLGVAVVAAALVWSGWRAVALDLHMLRDAREAAEGWLDGALRPGERVVGLGDYRMLPRLERSWPWREVRHRRESSGDPDVLVINPRVLNGDGAAIYRELEDGTWPYERVARIERPLPFDPIRIGGAETTIEFVNPPIEIWRRKGDSPPDREGLSAGE